MVVSVLCIFLRYSWLVCSVRSQSHSYCVLRIFLTILVMWSITVQCSVYLPHDTSWLVCSVRSQSHSQVLCIFLIQLLVCSVRSQSQCVCVIFLRYSWLVCSVRSQSQLHCHVTVSVLCIFLRYQLVSLQCSQSITVTVSVTVIDCEHCRLTVSQCSKYTDHLHLS